jgi:predicted SAM-dependent methyltransferase
METVQRLHWGCGAVTPAGWINSDLWEQPGVDIAADVLEGLPLEDDSIDYIVSNHVLPEIDLYDQEPALQELRRVLKPGGVLRLILPDLDMHIAAYQRGDRDHFLVHTWNTLAGNMITQVLWHGCIKTLFTYDFTEELARNAGFRDVRRVAYRQTASDHPEITDLDSRENESFYLEAWK